MKKLLSLLIALVVVISLSACGDLTGDPADKTPTSTTSTTSSSSVSSSEAVTLSEQVIFDSNDIKVTVTGMDHDNLFGPSVKVMLENNSSEDITVQTRKSSVNGVMADALFSVDVAAGKKANDSITFLSSDLEIAGVTTIKDIEFSLHIFNSDTWDTIKDSDLITLVTSADPSFVQSFDDSGFVAYDEDDIKIVVKKLTSEDSLLGSELYLYVENNSNAYLTIQARDVSINGFMVDPLFSCDVLPGKKAFDTMTFMDSDLEDNNITDITDLELKFHIFDADSWDTIKDSEIINIDFN